MQAADKVQVPEAQSTDAELAAATRGGDMRALAALYERHAAALMAVAYRLLSSREDSEDVLHDVFVGLPEALRKYDERGRLEPWLKRVTARVALSKLRSEKAERTVDLDAATIPPMPRVTADEMMTLDAAVNALPPSLRVVLVLKEIEGFTHAEIGAMLGISKGASEVRVHRALAALRATLTNGRGTR